MKNWDELRTAYEVAKSGTVTAAAEALHIHRATVIRHIDSLEDELGTKLFQRHGRGYTPTETGKDLFQVAGIADAEFSQLKARVKGRDELHGEFIVTSLEIVAPLLFPLLSRFQQQHPLLEIRYLTSDDLFKLEYGQAHVAIRSSTEKPDHPDYVVKAFQPMNTGLFAHRDYVKKHSKPQLPEDFATHQFVIVGQGSGFSRATINQWLTPLVPAENITLQSNSHIVRDEAIKAGMGIGVMFSAVAEQHTDLIEVYTPHSDWHITNWLVTHGDLHRSEKVQQFLRLLAE